MSSDSKAGPPPKPGGPSEPGVAFGRFRLLDKIGEGDVSEVYRAVVAGVEGFERRIAIKVMQPEVREEQPGRLFAEEARISALLDHPGAVQVYEFGTIDRAPFVAMEYLRAKNLEDTMNVLRSQGDRLSPALSVFIAHRVASVLAHAHDLDPGPEGSPGLVHGEVTPANVLLVREGAVKLLDFGSAALRNDSRYTVTRRGRPLPRHADYLSPEQVARQPLDRRSDVFSLGIVLWEMLTGRRLFAADSERKTLANVTRAEILSPSRLVPGIPPLLDRVVMSALARDPDRRCRSAETLARDLEQIIRALPSRHGDLSALLEHVWGSPLDTGPLKTLGGQPNVLPPPSRPYVPPVVPRPEAEVVRPAPKREVPTRVMGDTTLAALLGREPSSRPVSRWRWLSEPRTWVLGGVGIAAGLVIAGVLLTGQGRLQHRAPAIQAPPTPPAAPLPPKPPVLRPVVVAVPVPATPGPCPSADAGAPCLEPPTPTPTEPPRTTVPPPAPRPARRPAKPRPPSILPTPAPEPPRPLDDHRPNPFGD